MRINGTHANGTKWVIYWPSLGLLRAWLVMICLDLLSGSRFFLQPHGPSFLFCWAGVTLFRIVVAMFREI